MICSFCGTRAEDAGNMVMGEAGAAICDACVDLAVDLVRERTTPIGDMVLDNIGALATNTPRFPGLLGLVTDAALAIRNGRVVWAGPAERTPQGLRSLPSLDCGGRAVLPGLVDAHTHLAFAGDRSEEFVLRSTGMSGARAARSGGATTARLNHRADAAAIADIIGWRLNRMRDFGVTTVEASAGYSNEYERELALIGTVVEAGRHHVVDLVPTFDVLGLPVTASDRSRTLGEVAELHLPRAARLGAAVRLSLGTEALTTEEARRLIGVAAGLGTRTRIHHRGQTPDAYKLALEASVPVVDHAGFPQERTAEYFYNWQKGIAEFRGMDNVYMKISGLGMGDHMAGRRWTMDTIRPWVESCLEVFGVEQSFFGTNWPVDKDYSTYEELIDAYRELVSGYSEAEQTALFSGNASKVYRI